MLLREEKRVLWSGWAKGVFYRALWRGGRDSSLLCLRLDAGGGMPKGEDLI